MNVDLPDIRAESSEFELIRQETTTISFLGGSEVVVQGRAAKWVYSFTVVPMRDVDARKWGAALARLSKLTDTFRATPPAYSGPTAAYLGPTPEVNGSGQGGLTLDCDGVTPLITVAFAGDFIEVNEELKRLTEDAESDASGEVTFTFEPALRQSPANDAPVELQEPKATFRLVEPVATESKVPLFTRISVDAIETF